MSLCSRLCLPAPGTASGAVRAGGAPAERIHGPATAHTLRPRALHAAATALPWSLPHPAGPRQQSRRSGADALLGRLPVLMSSTAAPLQALGSNVAPTAASGSTWACTRSAVTARACLEAADGGIGARVMTRHQFAASVTRQTTGTGRVRRSRYSSRISVATHYAQRTPALPTAIPVTVACNSGGNRHPTAGSAASTWSAAGSATPPRKPAAAAARWHRWQCRAAHGEPAEQDGGLSDGAEGDPEV